MTLEALLDMKDPDRRPEVPGTLKAGAVSLRGQSQAWKGTLRSFHDNDL